MAKKGLLALLLFFLGVGLGQAAVTKVQPLRLDSIQLPPEVRFKGKLVAGVRWLDNFGENIIILSKFGPFPSKKGSSMPDEEGMDAEVHGYHYLKTKGKFALLWQTFDFVRGCPFDLDLNFLPTSLIITDLDKNGIAESTYLYKLACRSDVSPAVLKLIMHEGPKKYAIRGETVVTVGPNEKMGGTKKIDPAFATAPRVFKEFAIKRWLTFVEEKFN
jgi:hypothetical protein